MSEPVELLLSAETKGSFWNVLLATAFICLATFGCSPATQRQPTSFQYANFLHPPETIFVTQGGLEVPSWSFIYTDVFFESEINDGSMVGDPIVLWVPTMPVRLYLPAEVSDQTTSYYAAEKRNWRHKGCEFEIVRRASPREENVSVI